MAETTENKNKNYKSKAAKVNTGTSASAEPLNDGDTLLEGFTPAQIEALARVKQEVATGHYSDLTPEFKKLLFVKWLIEHDRIGS
ncbi:MAG: hypothetical protein WCD37_00650 [Chloroflexia bacterium]